MESQEVLASLAVTQTDITMPRFLSLPVELIERVGEQVISRQQAGLKTWCKVASTCKRLWRMQLPESAATWAMDIDVNVKGMSKVHIVRLT